MALGNLVDGSPGGLEGHLMGNVGRKWEAKSAHSTGLFTDFPHFPIEILVYTSKKNPRTVWRNFSSYGPMIKLWNDGKSGKSGKEPSSSRGEQYENLAHLSSSARPTSRTFWSSSYCTV